MKRVERVSVFTHRRPDETRPALGTLMESARAAGVTLRFSPEETAKHGLVARDGLEVDSERRDGIDLCFALGGDGTILTALRHFAGTGVPVFGVNFGEIGFLSTVERESAHEGITRAFAGDFDVLALPAITISGERPESTAMNDVSINRRPGSRVASLAYSVGSYEIGRVRCDGLVVATPAGSTGYNLANGGPVMAWGVEGFVVSFVAPHSLTARSLVVAPGDVLTVHNRSSEDAVDVSVDGRPGGPLEAGAILELRFADGLGRLAQLPGVTFYQRLREKFGRLATVP
jgi:NAD+ kinase